MRSAGAWFLLLTGASILAPYVLGVPPKTHRQRIYVAVTIAFVAWILLEMVPLRSR